MKKVFECKTCKRTVSIEAVHTTTSVDGKKATNTRMHSSVLNSDLQCVCGNYDLRRIVTA